LWQGVAIADKIAAVIVLFHPDESVVKNAASYCQHVGRLYAVDNSDQPNPAIRAVLEKHIPHLEYVPLGENAGIAKALNVAAEKALKDGFEWLLLMDQDSRFEEAQVTELLAVSKQVDTEKVGILAPQYLEEDATEKKEALQEVDTVITSGSLLNLEAYTRTGPFREDLFIDFVDHEYCLRLQQQGYKILVDNKVKLRHQLGNLSCHHFMGRRLCTSNHNYLRRYYITRNRLEMLQLFKDQFPEFAASEKNKNVVEMVKVLLFEKDKLRKLKSFVLGYLDFKRRKFGRYDY
jgi:rhamnosyltransferase